jgi:hypothetical protein
MRRKIYVTAEEMLELREQGLSNHDIAKSLDVSVPTVRRYIGRQDGHMEGLAAFKDAPRKKEEVKEEAVPMIPKYEPKPNREWYTVGELNLELNQCSKALGIEKEGELIILDFADVPDLVQFLAWAMRTRMEVTADAEQVREQEGDSERGGI